jgi:hypothetical protein
MQVGLQESAGDLTKWRFQQLGTVTNSPTAAKFNLPNNSFLGSACGGETCSQALQSRLASLGQLGVKTCFG